jgi:hypothetical protein
MSYRAERLQATNFAAEQKVFENLEKSSAATAGTLTATQSTMEGMNDALQKQLALFYDVEINMVYLEGSKKLELINNGRTNVQLWGGKIAGSKLELLRQPQLVTPSGAYIISLEFLHKSLSENLPKGTNEDIPVMMIVTNEKKEHFTIHAILTTVWNGGSMSFNTHPSEIISGWDK